MTDLEKKVKIYSKKVESFSHTSDEGRFLIIEESLSAHCCFGYTVIDITVGTWGYEDYMYWNSSICETFNKEEAVMICYALNQTFK